MSEFARKMSGTLWGVMRWEDLDRLWDAMVAKPGWYAYMPSEGVPAEPVPPGTLRHLLTELGALLRREHGKDYCGIVYADNRAEPTLVKVYDPNNLGSSCSHGEAEHVPRWIFSLDPPEDVRPADVVPGGRRRWWRALFGSR